MLKQLFFKSTIEELIMDLTQKNSLFAEILSSESATINGGRGTNCSYSSSSSYPKPSHVHYRDTLRILYPDTVVVRYDYRRGTKVDRYYYH
ncbi:hypothetical protein PN499_00740 [Kamptonema animale CS-326]|uniref:hypothetical protein n=1 Tax=Kamptonema animale TaxID=92934 RepID=UPI00232C7ECF|nr:hypothetical protein [Kamptonema animale]MDB9509731.1 hypothetical protein [Kamptonema animale CS-326]